MIELSHRNIVAVTAHPVDGRPDQMVIVGLMRVYQREGDGGIFRKAYLHENIETVLEEAARLDKTVRLEFVE